MSRRSNLIMVLPFNNFILHVEPTHKILLVEKLNDLLLLSGFHRLIVNESGCIKTLHFLIDVLTYLKEMQIGRKLTQDNKQRLFCNLVFDENNICNPARH